MKYINLLVFLMLTSLQSFAQLPISWQLGLEPAINSTINNTKIIETTDSCIYIFSNLLVKGTELRKPLTFGSMFYMHKLDRFGCLLWSSPIRSTSSNIFVNAIDFNDGFLISAVSNSKKSFDKSEDSYGGYDL